MRVSVNVPSLGGARPGQGGPPGGPRILRFLWPQHQAEAEQEEVVQVQGCGPREAEPEEEKLQTSERAGLWTRPWEWAGGGLTEAPRASAWTVSALLIPTGERPAQEARCLPRGGIFLAQIPAPYRTLIVQKRRKETGRQDPGG